MIIYLFGGSSPESDDAHRELVFGEIKKLNPSQLLFIGFGGSSRRGQIFKEELKALIGSKFLDASLPEDLLKAHSPLIFVAGGEDHAGAYEKVVGNERIKKLVFEAPYYMGSSLGAMITAEKMMDACRNGSPPTSGFGFLKNTVIEPHYTQWDRHQLLRDEMRDWKCSVGIGIDEACGIRLDTHDFPKKYIILGEGLVEVLKKYQDVV